MKKKIVWVVVSCLMVAALVLTSCGPAATEEEEVVTEEEEVVTEEEEVVTEEEGVVTEEEEVVTEEVPRYGGWFTTALSSAPTGVDDDYVSRPFCSTLLQTNEALVANDWTKGAAGTGEYDLTYASYYPGVVGYLAESWEFPDPDTIILHLKKGEDAVHWALNPDSEASRLVGGREVVAEDIAQSITRQFTYPTGWGYRQYRAWWEPGGSATATDDYTVVVKGHDVPLGTLNIWETLSGWFFIKPYDVVERYGDMKDWRNSVGTGAFMLTDYVAGSYATLVRNPNYWMKDPIGAGKGNQLPYLDGINMMVVLDASTRIAALRTGKIDILSSAGSENFEPLIKANPELQYKKLIAQGGVIFLKVKEEPFDDINVRRALSMAVDYQAIVDLYYGGDAFILGYPSAPVAGFMDAYTPIEELPESTRELFEYNPEKAEQLLDEAGYPGPERFTFPCLCTGEEDVNLLSIVKNDLAKIGVTLNIDVRDKAVFDTMRLAGTFKKSIISGAANVVTPLKLPGVTCGVATNYSGFCSQYVDDLYNSIWAFENVGKEDVRHAAKKALHEAVLAEAINILLPYYYDYRMWWPWVKNYHGEAGVAYHSGSDYTKFIWIDQDLKEEITGK